MLALVEAYGETFPGEKEEIYRLFLSTTRYATASNPMRRLYGELHHTGRIGAMGRFRELAGKTRKEGRETLEAILAGKASLGGNVGPGIWLLNTGFKIGRAVWVEKRDVPLAINLNTAGVIELMTIPGIDLAVARKIEALRDEKGYFASLEDVKKVKGLTAESYKAMVSMKEAL